MVTAYSECAELFVLTQQTLDQKKLDLVPKKEDIAVINRQVMETSNHGNRDTVDGNDNDDGNDHQGDDIDNNITLQ